MEQQTKTPPSHTLQKIIFSLSILALLGACGIIAYAFFTINNLGDVFTLDTEIWIGWSIYSLAGAFVLGLIIYFSIVISHRCAERNELKRQAAISKPSLKLSVEEMQKIANATEDKSKPTTEELKKIKAQEKKIKELAIEIEENEKVDHQEEEKEEVVKGPSTSFNEVDINKALEKSLNKTQSKLGEKEIVTLVTSKVDKRSNPKLEVAKEPRILSSIPMADPLSKINDISSVTDLESISGLDENMSTLVDPLDKYNQEIKQLQAKIGNISSLGEEEIKKMKTNIAIASENREKLLKKMIAIKKLNDLQYKKAAAIQVKVNALKAKEKERISQQLEEKVAKAKQEYADSLTQLEREKEKQVAAVKKIRNQYKPYIKSLYEKIEPKIKQLDAKKDHLEKLKLQKMKLIKAKLKENKLKLAKQIVLLKSVGKNRVLLGKLELGHLQILARENDISFAPNDGREKMISKLEKINPTKSPALNKLMIVEKMRKQILESVESQSKLESAIHEQERMSLDVIAKLNMQHDQEIKRLNKMRNELSVKQDFLRSSASQNIEDPEVKKMIDEIETAINLKKPL